MKKRRYFLVVLALATIMTAGIGRAWAYFTTYAQAYGGKTIHLGDETEITESFSAETKHIQIASEAGSEPVYIRVKAFAGKDYTENGVIDHTPVGSGEDWTEQKADGFYYYVKPVEGGSSTSVLELKIPDLKGRENKDPLNVIVIYESTPVRYDENGDPVGYDGVDWNETLDRHEITAPVTPTAPGSGEGGSEG